MGATEDAAIKRVIRAVEKLRKYFSKRGVNSTTAIIAGAISANSVQVAPPGLAKTAALIAVSKSAATAGSTLTLIKGALKLMAWTKAKTAVVIGVGILLAAGTTTVVVQRVIAKSRSPANGPAWADRPNNWALNSKVLDRLPPAFILRPTRFPSDGGAVRSGNRQLSKNAGLEDLVADAYSYAWTRIVLPPNLPTNRFDFLYTLSSRPEEALQKELKQQFGIVAHRENRDLEVFRLHVSNPNPPNLKRSDTGDGSGMWSSTSHKITIRNQPLGGFIGSIESTMGQPVLDETGLNGRYDLDLQWQLRPGESEKDAYRRALSEQLGLELVPDNAPIELLVVEKAN